MKLILFVFQLFMCSVIFSQIDSSYIKQFYNKETFPNVIGIEYKVKKVFGQTISEGWIITEKSGPNATILVVEGTDENQLLEHKFGIWNYFYFGKKIKQIDTITYSNNQRIGSQNYFHRNGKLDYRWEMISKSQIDELRLIGKNQDLDNKLFEPMIYYKYNSMGKLIRKQIWDGKTLIFDEMY